MKNGFFKSAYLPLLMAALLYLPGCASFLQIGDHGDDPAEYDRGYDADSEYDEEESNTEATANADEESDTSDELVYGKRRVKRAIAARDVVLGMTRKEVSDSWGQPTQREVAGRGDGGHERWTYGSRYSLSGSRTVIFENGRVAGWSQ
jgi:hypothetical protein